jgi:ribose transport system substrate-binding protein
MKRKWFLIVAVVLAVGMLFSFSLIGCKTTTTTTTAAETTAAGKELVIGFIAMNQTMEWMTYALKSAQAAADEAGIKMVVYDAEDKIDKQGSLMEDLIAQKVDAIITDPISVESLNPFLVAADKAGIPVATFDRRAEGAPYFAFIGCDDVMGGTLDAKFIADKLGGKGDIVVLVGQLGAGPTIDRGTGFDTELKNYPDLKVVFSQTANFMKEDGLKVMEDAITKTGGKFDAVYSYNDSMMLGALQAMNDAGLDQSKIVTVSYDGVPDVLAAIRDGNLDATTQYPVGMAGAIVKVVVDYLRNGTVPEKKDDKIDPWIITKDNLETGDFYSLMK